MKKLKIVGAKGISGQVGSSSAHSVLSVVHDVPREAVHGVLHRILNNDWNEEVVWWRKSWKLISWISSCLSLAMS